MTKNTLKRSVETNSEYDGMMTRAKRRKLGESGQFINIPFVEDQSFSQSEPIDKRPNFQLEKGNATKRKTENEQRYGTKTTKNRCIKNRKESVKRVDFTDKGVSTYLKNGVAECGRNEKQNEKKNK